MAAALGCSDVIPKQTFLDWRCDQIIKSTNRGLFAAGRKIQELNECEVGLRKDLEVGPRQGGFCSVGAVSKESLEADSTGLRDRPNIMSQIVLRSTRID
jgi:hypothetical protein